MSVYERGLAGQNEAKGGLNAGQVVGDGWVDVDQLSGCSAQELLGDRAGEALEATLDDVLVNVVDGLRSGT